MQQALYKYSPSSVLEGLELFEECWSALQLKWESWSPGCGELSSAGLGPLMAEIFFFEEVLEICFKGTKSSCMHCALPRRC